MGYKTLRAVFHERDMAAALAEERARRSSPSAISWNYRLGEHEIFCLITPEIAALTDKIMSQDRAAERLGRMLSPAMWHHYFRKLIISEIFATNEIENVRSTRREISSALDSLSRKGRPEAKRFRELAGLYVSIGDEAITRPSSLADIRAVYDAVAAGEIPDDDAPDGHLFRAGPVAVHSGMKEIHKGAEPESAINDGLTIMLEQSVDEQIPVLVRTLVGHLIFETVHPFYDGNGRVGRFLLAADLSKSFGPLTGLSLSSAIAEEKAQYYKAFTEAEDTRNLGDITPFILVGLRLIAIALDRLVDDLGDLGARLHRLQTRVEELEADSRPVFFVLGQAAISGEDGIVTLDEITEASEWSKQTIRRRAQALVDDGLAEVVSRRPLRFRLSPAGRDLLQVEQTSTSP